MDDAEYQPQHCGLVEDYAAMTIGPGRQRVVFTGGRFAGGSATCEEIVGAARVFHDGTVYERRGARNDVIITGGASRVIWDRCPGLRWIVAGDFSEADLRQTGPCVRDCEVNRAPLEEITVVVCINSEPFRGDVFNLRIPWRWLHFRCVAAYFWLRRTWVRTHASDDADDPSKLKSA
jgi:hypothetical protein